MHFLFISVLSYYSKSDKINNTPLILIRINNKKYIFSAKICCHDEISRTWVTLTGPPPTTPPPPPPPHRTGASRTWWPASWIRSELRAAVVRTAQLRTLLLKENLQSLPRYRHPYIWLTKLFYYVIWCTLRIFVDISDFHGSLVLHKLQARRLGPAAKETDGVSPVRWSRGWGESRLVPQID